MTDPRGKVQTFPTTRCTPTVKHIIYTLHELRKSEIRTSLLMTTPIWLLLFPLEPV